MSSTLSTKAMHIYRNPFEHHSKANKTIVQIINLASSKIMELREAININ